MKYSSDVKLIVFVPIKSADSVRSAIHEAGAGNSGDYSRVSYSTRVTSRFTPGDNADPEIGEPNIPQHVEEERIEFLCPKEKLQEVIKAMKEAHPYEEVAYDVLKRVDI